MLIVLEADLHMNVLMRDGRRRPFTFIVYHLFFTILIVQNSRYRWHYQLIRFRIEYFMASEFI